MNELLPLIVGSDSRPLKEEDAFGSSAETGTPRPGSGISACSSSVSTPLNLPPAQSAAASHNDMHGYGGPAWGRAWKGFT